MEYKDNIENVANYFLSVESMTPKKLQKIVYYAFAWYIVGNNDSNNISKLLFNEIPQAWVHGPVFPQLYDKYKEYKWNQIPSENNIEIEEELKKFLDEIWNVFGKYDGDTLELMTHNEEPWIDARKELDSMEPSNIEINVNNIYDYYSSL